MAIIQAAIHMSVSKMMSSRKGGFLLGTIVYGFFMFYFISTFILFLGYHVDDNQELFALSTTHLVAGFWPVFPTATR